MFTDVCRKLCEFTLILHLWDLNRLNIIVINLLSLLFVTQVDICFICSSRLYVITDKHFGTNMLELYLRSGS